MSTTKEKMRRRQALQRIATLGGVGGVTFLSAHCPGLFPYSSYSSYGAYTKYCNGCGSSRTNYGSTYCNYSNYYDYCGPLT